MWKEYRCVLWYGIVVLNFKINKVMWLGVWNNLKKFHFFFITASTPHSSTSNSHHHQLCMDSDDKTSVCPFPSIFIYSTNDYLGEKTTNDNNAQLPPTPGTTNRGGRCVVCLFYFTFSLNSTNNYLQVLDYEIEWLQACHTMKTRQ